MMITTITGNKDFLENLKGKSATFLLAMSNTKTANIEGITQAGIPGLIHLTPTLDAEFLCTGKVKSLDNIAETPKGVPTPALITRAVHLLKPFKEIELLDLGLEKIPQVEAQIYGFKIPVSDRIDQHAKIDASAVFSAGKNFGENYEAKSDYIILAESTPSGTTTALATALALGYDCEEKFSSSFKNNPSNIKKEVIQKALSHIHPSDTILEKVSKVSDNMLIFNAGFLLGASSKNTPIILAGGTQMAAVLLLLNALTPNFDSKNIALWTTKWIYHDSHSDIKALLEMLDFPIHAFSSEFDFSLSHHPALKLYDEGEAKEGVGAGAALVYGMLNGLTQEEITKKVESFLG
ncbi:MAG TPA: TIGR00303 family protein [Campylobacterales bacterium]|nr:TIGR00303 family protein [Campylobacterales bacterium]